MPATDYQGSSAPFSSIGRTILSLRRDHLHSMDGHDGGGSSQDQELEAFQRHVADLFLDLSSSAAGGEDLLSLSWVRKLLDAFLICQEEFRVILFNSKGILSRAPLDRLISDFFERGVKALDVCNAIRDGIDQIRQWKKHLEIVLVALHPSHRTLGEGQLHRARKALTHVTILMLDHFRLHRRHSSPVLPPPIPARLHATAPIPISTLARNRRSLPCLAPRINLPRLLHHRDSTRRPISAPFSLPHGF